MDRLHVDVRFAVRNFVRRPGMVLLALFTLALGIGSSSAMFSVIDAVVLSDLPYPEPDELVSVYPSWPELAGHPTLGEAAERGTWSWPEFFAVLEQQEVFETLAAYQPFSMTLSGDGRPERVRVAETTWELFPMLGVTPVRGRLFDRADASTGDERVALLTESYWRERFAGEAAVLDGTLTLDDRAYRVVGVVPDFHLAGVRARLWIPKTGSSTDPGFANHGGTHAIARLADGVSPERAEAEVARILVESTPPEHGVHGASVFDRRADETRNVRGVLFAMLGAAVLLLVVACGNVATVLLSAGIEREQELAVRTALGATRRRVVQQILTESALLALVASLGGIALAWASTKALTFVAPPGVPRLDEVGLDVRVLAFAVGIAGACGIVFGLIPALGLSRVELARAMGAARATDRRKQRLQAAVVVSELALATVLLVSGALLTRTVVALGGVDPGFAHDELLTVSIGAPYQRFRENGEFAPQQADQYFQSMVDELRSLPGVRAVAMTSVAPLTGDRSNNNVQPEGWDENTDAPVAERRFVSRDYFETLSIPIVQGRGFGPQDDAPDAPPAVVVSQGLADLAWPGEDPIGRRMDYWDRSATVVGVAANVRDQSLDRPTAVAFYAPARQHGTLQGSFLLRTEGGDPATLAAGARERIWAVDPDVPIVRVIPGRELVSETFAQERYRARLMAVFAGLAAVFALMGVYGVTARSVARRTRELGIRLALGAERADVVSMVLRQGFRLALYGALLGVLISLVASRILEDMLYGVSRTDLVSILGTAALVGLASIVAALPPSRRATRVDPREALRTE